MLLVRSVSRIFLPLVPVSLTYFSASATWGNPAASCGGWGGGDGPLCSTKAA